MKNILLIMLVISATTGVLLNSNFFRRKSFFYYFTNISNTLVALYYLLELLPQNPMANKYIHFTITMAILVTFIIYHFVISKGTRMRKDPEEMKDYNSLKNRLVHYITPFFATLYYLLYSEATLNLFESMTWVIYPLVYTTTMMIRAKNGTNIPDRDSRYPYDFIDLDKHSSNVVIRNSVLTSLFFLVLGVVIAYVQNLI